MPCVFGRVRVGAPFSAKTPQQFRPSYYFTNSITSPVGRSYWFECSKCGYRTKVAGRADRGLSFFVQTIVCRDCKELYDAVSRVKVPDESGLRLRNLGLR